MGTDHAMATIYADNNTAISLIKITAVML